MPYGPYPKDCYNNHYSDLPFIKIKKNEEKFDFFTVQNTNNCLIKLFPHSSDSKIIVCLSICICGDFYTSYARIRRQVAGTSDVDLFQGTGAGVRPIAAVCTTGDNGIQDSHGQQFLVHRQFIDEPGTTAEITYQVQAQGRPDNSANGATRINYSVPDRNTNSYDARQASEIMVMEISG